MVPFTHLTQLVPEDVNLIQEQNNRCPEKPSRVDHRIEKDERFSHSVLNGTPVLWDYDRRGCMGSTHLVLCFHQNLIVLA